jgi:hypothetical protein
MHQLFRRSATLILICTLNACATLSPEQCRTVNWYDLGVEDGRAGYEADRLARHREACAEVGVIPDEKRYMQGRKLGLKSYCTADSAVQEGLAGHRYEGSCSGNSGAVFKRFYDAAYAVYEARQKIERIDSGIASKEREIRDGKTSEDRRRELHSEIRGLDRERDGARDELGWRERDLDRVRSAH